MNLKINLLCIWFLFSSLIGMSFNDNRSSHALMATFGNSSPANNFESYGDNGFTYKVVYERPFIDYSNLRYNIGWQNIRFSENVIGYEDWQGLQIREGSRANLFDLGLKFIMSKGLNGSGLFRPYLNTSVGFGFFKEYTIYDYPDTFASDCDTFLGIIFNILTDDDCDTVVNDNSNSITNSRMSTPFFTLDLGTSFAFSKSAIYSIEFGIRYLMVNKIKSTDWSNWQSINSTQTFNQVIGKSLGADYKSIYLGFSFYFNNKGKNKERNKTKKGKYI